MPIHRRNMVIFPCDMATTLEEPARRRTQRDGEENSDALALGELEAFWSRRDQASSLHRDLEDGLGEPSPPIVRVERPQRRVLRRLRAGHHRHARLDDGRYPS